MMARAIQADVEYEGAGTPAGAFAGAAALADTLPLLMIGSSVGMYYNQNTFSFSEMEGQKLLAHARFARGPVAMGVLT